ncbi:MAG: PadR family transcriptional regulator [Cyanobacteria bacterium J06555_13]
MSNEPQNGQFAADGQSGDDQSSAIGLKQSAPLESSSERHDLEDLPSLSALEEDILTSLVGYPLYGLQICQAIKESSAGQQILKIGSLYPSLHRLEAKGLVTSWMSASGVKKRGGNRRKYYRMTIRGASALSQKREMRMRLEQWSKNLTPSSG